MRVFDIRGMGLGYSQASGKQSVQKMPKEISLDKEETWLLVWNHGILCFHILGMSSSQLTKSYFSEGWLNHQPASEYH